MLIESTSWAWFGLPSYLGSKQEAIWTFSSGPGIPLQPKTIQFQAETSKDTENGGFPKWGVPVTHELWSDFPFFTVHFGLAPMEKPKIIRSHRPIHEDSCATLSGGKWAATAWRKWGLVAGVRWNPTRWQMLGGFLFFELSMMFGMFGTKTTLECMELIGVDCSWLQLHLWLFVFHLAKNSFAGHMVGRTSGRSSDDTIDNTRSVPQRLPCTGLFRHAKLDASQPWIHRRWTVGVLVICSGQTGLVTQGWH